MNSLYPFLSLSRFGFHANREKKSRSAAKKKQIGVSISVYVRSQGNYYFHEIADLICCGCIDAGFEVKRGDESTGFLDKTDWHIIIAPHEFFIPFGSRTSHTDLPSHTVLVNTEQPALPWFDIAKLFFEKAYAVWDIDYSSWKKIKKHHPRTSFLPLGYSARFDLYRTIPTLPQNYSTCFLSNTVKKFCSSIHEWNERPLDVIFIGHASDRRKVFFARSAPFLSKYHCYIHLKKLNDRVRAGKNTSLDSRTVHGLVQRSKIVLNMHQSDGHYFESHRIIMQAIAHQALVVTETSGQYPPFQAGKDFIMRPIADIRKTIEYFLSPYGSGEAKKIINHAYATFRANAQIGNQIKKNLSALYKA